ncbi:regucalcin-like [Anopheles arabiensis]|uniref:Regucalcin n=2 Tax=gambiae species complex TaxID=44542 RepID=A0A8W7PFG7_ANOCL|nr:regucalcin-like [Anopheles arabiensis]
MAESYRVAAIPPYTELGEGPHWDIARQSLYYVSLTDALIYRWDYREGKVYSASIDGIRFATFIVPVKGRSDCFVIGDTIRLLVIRWDGKASKATIVRELACLGPDHVDNRFNDGKVDPWGRLYVGSMLNESAGNPFEKATGALWRYCDRTGQMVEQDRNMYISNGLAWNRATNKFYFVDSGANHIKEYDIDLDGNLINPRIWYDFKPDGADPGYFGDGMTIDSEGNLYVACFNGYKVVKISPEKKILAEYKVPAKQVTSASFGGPKLDDLFVTTAAKNLTGPQEEPAGAVFKISGIGAKGLAMNEVVLKD